MPSLSAIDAAGAGLRVVFERDGDRWRHVIERVTGAEVTLLLASREGTAADVWPASPPFQELSQETLPDGRSIIFLVGRAGTSHWSASVEAFCDPPRLVFDVACRHSAEPEFLGSIYAVEAVTEIVGCDDLAQVTVAGDSTLIVPAIISQRLPGTTRWKYVVTFTR